MPPSGRIEGACPERGRTDTDWCGPKPRTQFRSSRWSRIGADGAVSRGVVPMPHRDVSREPAVNGVEGGLSGATSKETGP